VDVKRFPTKGSTYQKGPVSKKGIMEKREIVSWLRKGGGIMGYRGGKHLYKLTETGSLMKKNQFKTKKN